MKEIVKFYHENEGSAPGFKKITKITSLKKEGLIAKLISEIPPTSQTKLIEQFESDFVQDLIENAFALKSQETLNRYRTNQYAEEIINTAPVGRTGFKAWFKGRGWFHSARVNYINNQIERSCNCHIGREGGLCKHQISVFLLMYMKKQISLTDFPFKINQNWFNSIEKKMELLAHQKLFKEEPAIVMDEDYDIYIHKDLVTLEWGGKYPGKVIKDMQKEGKNLDEFLTEKVTSIILRKIKVTQGTGYPIKILVDSYGIIDKIIQDQKKAKKILKYFTALKDESLPHTIEDLGPYLSQDLRSSNYELNLEPPFEAYSGEDPYMFISYTHADKSEVFPIIEMLHNYGFKIWYDEGIPLSIEWEPYIFDRLEHAGCILSFISTKILTSDVTKKEIIKAINEGKPFLGIYLNPVDSTKMDEAMIQVRKIQGLEKFAMTPARFEEKLKVECGRILDLQPSKNEEK